MIAGALILGIAAGITGFILTLATGGGFLWALAAYMSIGSLVTLAVMLMTLTGGRMARRLRKPITLQLARIGSAR